MDRINKFHDDGKALLIGKDLSNRSTIIKIRSEVNRLSVWLHKHQDEQVTDGGKSKLLSTLEGYYRFSVSLNDQNVLWETILNLLCVYLQLPEGKLVSAKDKKKVLNWQQSLISDEKLKSLVDFNAEINDIDAWIVDSLDEVKGTVNLFSEKNPDVWKEDYKVCDQGILNKIKAKIKECDDNGELCLILLSEISDEIIGIQE